MQKTQFRLDDGHNFYNDYGTTMKVSYVPKDATGKILLFIYCQKVDMYGLTHIYSLHTYIAL